MGNLWKEWLSQEQESFKRKTRFRGRRFSGNNTEFDAMITTQKKKKMMK
jgi:hypothetical protein